MGEQINKEFDDFQKDLEIRNKKLKMHVSFDFDSDIGSVVEELKGKEIEL